MTPSFDFGSALRFGWMKFRERPWALIGIFLAATGISILVSLIVQTISEGGVGIGMIVALQIADFVVQTFIGMGLITVALKAHDNIASIELKDLWRPHPFWYYVIATILLGLITAVGFVLLIIPGFIAMVMLLFTPYLVMDRALGPIEALRESARITKGSRWQLLWLMLSLFAINIIGALLLFVGLLVTIPVSMLAIVYAYRTLAGGAQSAGESEGAHE